MNADCDHGYYDWPAWVPVRTFELRDASLPCRLQWCSYCGAVREINGTEIGAWIVPTPPIGCRT